MLRFLLTVDFINSCIDGIPARCRIIDALSIYVGILQGPWLNSLPLYLFLCALKIQKRQWIFCCLSDFSIPSYNTLYR